MSVFTNAVVSELQDGSGTPITSTGGALDVNIKTPATLAVTQSTSPWVVSGTVSTTPSSSSTATITRVATSTTDAIALAANASRKKAIITTETGNTYVAFGSVATTTNYTYLLSATSVLEITTWTGSIHVIRQSGSGSIQVTELV